MLYPPQLVLWEVILAKVIQSGPEAPVSHETCTLVPRFGKEGRHKGEWKVEEHGLGSEPKLLQSGEVFLFTSKGFEESPKDKGTEVWLAELYQKDLASLTGVNFIPP